MKIIVTGALGHIGSRLIRDLPAKFPGSEIVLFDNLSTQRYCSLFNLPREARYRFIEGSVLQYDLSALFAGSDVIVHLAAITEAAGSYDRQEEVEQVNFEGTKRVAEACSAAGVPLIFLSTTSVYTPEGATVDESCGEDNLKPQTPYAISKLRAERYLSEAHEKHGLEFVTLRFGTIFGVSPGMRFHTAVNKFCWQAVMGHPISVWTTALHQNRPYLDLGDAVQALSSFIEKKYFDSSIYNVVTLNSTVNDILDYIRAFLPALDVELVESKAANNLSFAALTPKMDRLGLRPKGDIRAAVGETISLLRNANRF